MNIVKDSEDDNKVEIERVAESPNIDTNSSNLNELEEAITTNIESKTTDAPAEQKKEIIVIVLMVSTVNNIQVRRTKEVANKNNQRNNYYIWSF